MDKKPQCLADGCSNFSKTKGYCSNHYNQILIYGEIQGKKVTNSEKYCIAELCKKRPIARDLCPTHYARYKKHGTYKKITN